MKGWNLSEVRCKEGWESSGIDEWDSEEYEGQENRNSDWE